MDVKFINPFIAAISNVFQTMVHAKIKIGKPMLKQSDLVSAEVSGIIGLSGDVMGCVVLSFPGDVACKIASAFAGTELTMKSPDFSDAIGELANMVAGNAKKDFGDHLASISLPSVVIGPGHQVSPSKLSPFLIIPCETEFGGFNVEVAVIPNKKPAGKSAQSVAVGAV
ncbi:MAG TPA: chemotaxis protein CheX [Phycisphaerae bacterium]|nr:chemotaxis protein CheX [Phycisphaerae bacterium]